MACPLEENDSAINGRVILRRARNGPHQHDDIVGMPSTSDGFAWRRGARYVKMKTRRLPGNRLISSSFLLLCARAAEDRFEGLAEKDV